MSTAQISQDMPYYRYSASHDNTTTDGRVCKFERDARDRLFKDSGLVKEVAKATAEDVGCAYVFDPAIEIKPGMVITIRD